MEDEYPLSLQIEDELIDSSVTRWFHRDYFSNDQIDYLEAIGVDLSTRTSRYPIIEALKTEKKSNVPKTITLDPESIDLIGRHPNGGGPVHFELDSLPGWFPIGPFYFHLKGSPRTERLFDYPFRTMSCVRKFINRMNRRRENGNDHSVPV